MISLTDLVLFFLLVLAVVYWWRGRETHTHALANARHYCQQRNIQLLDETLVFQKFTFATAANGRRYFCRVYNFDFCPDVTDRYKGEIILRGNRVMRVVLESEDLEITEY